MQAIVNVIESGHGIVFDPACGSGGMFVQSSHFIERLGQDTAHRVTFFGQEKTATTIRLAKMNLAVHGLEGDIREANTFYEDVHELHGKCGFVMANPPFNVDMVDAEKIKDDRRLPFGLPGVNKAKKVSNGNYLWISYFHSYLSPNGRAGFVMSSQASSAGHGEAEVRRKIVETGDVDVMIAIRSNFFYMRTVPCELWHFDRGKPEERRDRVLMLDARNIYRKVTRKIYDFTPEQLANLTAIVWLYRGQSGRFIALVQQYLDRTIAEAAGGAGLGLMPDFAQPPGSCSQALVVCAHKGDVMSSAVKSSGIFININRTKRTCRRAELCSHSAEECLIAGEFTDKRSGLLRGAWQFSELRRGGHRTSTERPPKTAARGAPEIPMKMNDTPGQSRRRTVKRIVVLIVTLLVAGVVALGLSVRSTVMSVPRLFERNAELKAQGYYLGEFEFKMLAAQYYLNESSYIKAYLTLRRIRDEMETTRGLLRMPAGASPEQQMDFLLARQDPSTGAFMDPRYPLFTYYAPTENVAEAIHDLARQTGRPFKLNYPLRFLDQLREPDQLRAYLESLLYLKEPWARMAAGPGPYGPGVSELASFWRLEDYGLYSFSDEWEETLRKFIYETQDPATGLWGYRIGSPGNWRQNPDVNSTFHVLKLVLDSQGENQSRKYPLRYAGTLARSLLAKLDKPVPNNALKQHGWCLDQSQGTRMVTWLQSHLSEAERAHARQAMQTYLAVRYRHFYRAADGAFSLYTASPRADVDGTSTALALLRATGSLPGTREREKLWGEALAAGPTAIKSRLTPRGESALPAEPVANSVRVFVGNPPGGDTYEDTNLAEIIYPGDSPVLDLMDLRQRIAGFVAAAGQEFGNWKSKESFRETLQLGRETKSIPVSRGGVELEDIARRYPDARKLTVVGYDVFQVPVYKLELSPTGTR